MFELGYLLRRKPGERCRFHPDQPHESAERSRAPCSTEATRGRLLGA